MIVDLFLVYQFIKRLATPFKEWDAYKTGIIDEKGNLLKKTKDLTTREEKDSWGKFDLMILKLKKLLEKIPGGDTRLGSYAAALWLIKEGKDYDDSLLTEELIENKLQPYMNYVRENVDMEEDAPANSAGGGAIAGIGVGTDGEPGFTPAQMKKHKKKTGTLKRFKDIK